MFFLSQFSNQFDLLSTRLAVLELDLSSTPIIQNSRRLPVSFLLIVCIFSFPDAGGHTKLWVGCSFLSLSSDTSRTGSLCSPDMKADLHYAICRAMVSNVTSGYLVHLRVCGGMESDDNTVQLSSKLRHELNKWSCNTSEGAMFCWRTTVTRCLRLRSGESGGSFDVTTCARCSIDVMASNSDKEKVFEVSSNPVPRKNFQSSVS